MDRFDLRIDVTDVAWSDLDLPPTGETSAEVAARVQAARDVQARRFAQLFPGQDRLRQNADADGRVIEEIGTPDPQGRALLARAAERFGISARGYHRILRVARTIADLDHSDQVRSPHVAEAVGYRGLIRN